MKLGFEKWHGCQNDFMVVWLNPSEKSVLSSLQKRAPELCSKKGDGVGADGILVFTREKVGQKTPKQLTIVNSDGSLASNCGNGLRCATLSIVKQFTDEELEFDLEQVIEINVGDNTYYCRLLGDHLPSLPSGRWPYVVVEMSVPLLQENLEWCGGFAEETDLRKDSAFCEVGNPHLVYFNQELKDKENLLQHAESLQNVSAIDGTNVHFTAPMEVGPDLLRDSKKVLGVSIEDAFEVLVYERGVGPTPACGSGACAVVATACSRYDAAYQQWVAIKMPGGILYTKQEDVESPVQLAGPAEFVFEGSLHF